MSYDIIVRFPNQEVARKFCSQMSDGFGEGFCNFNSWEQIPGTDGTKDSHFRKVKSAAPEGTPVYFVDRIFEI
jgi:hypothetical protein